MITGDKKELERYKAIFDNRKSEIDRFWNRSLFFWGFIAASFIAFANLYNKNVILSSVIAFFGFVCSLFWYLINRGSKFWQEYWEDKIGEIERNITGQLFSATVEDKNKWYDLFAPARFSVSKVTISLSLYTSLIWLLIIIDRLLVLLQLVINNNIFILLSILTIYWIIRTIIESLWVHKD